MNTRAQEYAKAVFERVTAFKQLHTDTSGKVDQVKISEYGSMAHKLPVLIRTAGLAQALAFVAASGSKKEQQKKKGYLHPHRQLLEDLAKVVSQPSGKKFLKASRNEQIDEYIRLTRESLAALLWFKRFAQSLLDIEAGDSGDERAA